MAPIILDSTVLIDILRGRPAAERVRGLAADREPLLTTAINVEEIHRGLRDTEADAATALFTAVRVLPIRREDGERAGRWRREFARRGIPLHQADCLIAAAAVAFGGRLATGNPEDYPMPELTVDHLPVGR